MTPKALAFIQSVLQLKPKLAVFDCDGTLWAGDAGEGFFDWELRRGLVSEEMVRWARSRYAEYQAGRVSEDEMCAEMVTVNRGLREGELLRATVQYFDEHMVGQIFPEMKEMVLRLHNLPCDVWAVSSTSDWGIQAGMRHFNIPRDRIIAAAAVIEHGKITDKMVRIPSGKGKPQAIYEVIGQSPDVVFGNSIWDADMLEIARYPFAINPTPQLETIARERRWPLYRPEPIPGS
jgi:phosphoserine phosphatase